MRAYSSPTGPARVVPFGRCGRSRPPPRSLVGGVGRPPRSLSGGGDGRLRGDRRPPPGPGSGVSRAVIPSPRRGVWGSAGRPVRATVWLRDVGGKARSGDGRPRRRPTVPVPGVARSARMSSWSPTMDRPGRPSWRSRGERALRRRSDQSRCAGPPTSRRRPRPGSCLPAWPSTWRRRPPRRRGWPSWCRGGRGPGPTDR